MSSNSPREGREPWKAGSRQRTAITTAPPPGGSCLGMDTPRTGLRTPNDLHFLTCNILEINIFKFNSLKIRAGQRDTQTKFLTVETCGKQVGGYRSTE